MLVFRLISRGATPRHIRGRVLQTIRRAAYHAVGRHWFEHFRPKHFTQEGGEEYGYQKRKGELIPKGSKRYKRSYTGRKEAQFGHTRPLVFSGKSEERTRGATIAATSNKVQVRMNAPALNFKPPKSRINMRAELLTVSARELIELGQVYDDGLQQGFDEVSQTSTQTF